MRRAAWLAATAVLAGCATVPPPAGVHFAGRWALLDGTERWIEGYAPDGRARALVTLQHGFTRRCSNLREVAAALAREGLATLCVDADLAGGNPDLAAALADALDDGLSGADGRSLPTAVVAAGHSAGASFALHLAARLRERAPARVAGVLMLDPVPGVAAAQAAASLARAGVPLRALLAPPHPCNDRGLARRALAGGAVRLDEAPPGATHADIEGLSPGWLATAACGQPQPAAVKATQAWLVDAAVAAVDGR